MLNSDHIVIKLVLVERSRRIEEVSSKVIFTESSSVVLFMLPHFPINGVLLLSSLSLPILVLVLEIMPNVSFVLTIIVVVLLLLLVCSPLMLHLVPLLLGKVSSLPLLPLMLSLFPLAILVVYLSHDFFEKSRDIFETFKKL